MASLMYGPALLKALTGALSIEGTVEDRKRARLVLRHAARAIEAQVPPSILPAAVGLPTSPPPAPAEPRWVDLGAGVAGGGQLVTPHAGDVVAWVTARLHTNQTISVGGTLFPRETALRMLEEAREALRPALAGSSLVVPARDVEVTPHAGLREVGDIPEAERGDP